MLNLSNELLAKTTKRLEDDFWSYSIASRLLLSSFVFTSGDIREEKLPQYGRMIIGFDDKDFYHKKNLISKSKIITRLAKERGLDFVLFYFINEDEFIIKLRNLPGVRYLNLGLVRSPSDATMLEIGRTCVDIDSLALDDMPFRISNQVLHGTLRKLKKIKKLSLFGSQQANDQTMVEIGSHNKELEDLNVGSCHNITDEGIYSITTNLQNLRKINLVFNKNITDESLEAFGRHSKYLDEIDLTYCPNVSDAGLKELFEGCLELKRVVFHGRKVTKTFIENAKEKYKHVSFM